MADATQTDAGAADAAPSILERIFDDGRLVRDEHQVDSARRMLHGFIEEATTRLMPEAVRAARTRAQSLASAESRAVGRLVRIVESGVSHRPPVLERPIIESASAARSSADRGIPVHSGAGLVVTVTVEAIFELE